MSLPIQIYSKYLTILGGYQSVKNAFLSMTSCEKLTSVMGHRYKLNGKTLEAYLRGLKILIFLLYFLSYKFRYLFRSSMRLRL